MEPNKNYEVFNEELEVKLKEIGYIIGGQLPKGWGFTLLLFDFNKKDDGSTFYISNAQRKDMIKAMQEFIDKQKGSPKK